jgi:hypothetical protein
MEEIFFPGMLESLIKDGVIDPVGKDEIQLRNELMIVMRDNLAQGEELQFKIRISHEETLLREARRYVEAGKLHLAVVMFATWLEHRLNNMLVWGAKKRGLTEHEVLQLLKKASIDEKTGLTWKLVLNEDFPMQLAGLIRNVANRRNAFVHYKWQTSEDGDLDPQHAPMKAAIEDAERAVRDLERMYRRLVLKGFGGPGAP